jgi:hypothetical protein
LNEPLVLIATLIIPLHSQPYKYTTKSIRSAGQKKSQKKTEIVQDILCYLKEKLLFSCFERGEVFSLCESSMVSEARL